MEAFVFALGLCVVAATLAAGLTEAILRLSHA